ncbi:MAG: hypothetical protein J6K97_00155 [Clostridia bacterium]|nr:hypothetical protein [Clostridia bacterium]
MDNSILQLLMKFMDMGQNFQPQQPSPQNPASSFYPKEAFENNIGQNNQNCTQNNQNQFAQIFSALNGTNGNNMLPLLMSMLGKGNPIASILEQSVKKEEEPPSSPNDEILL